jgi:electron transfer flavoprotein alpha subunit
MIQSSIWVFGETVDERPTKWTLELVSEARRLADQLGEARVGALSDGDAPTLDLAERGADVVALFGTTPDDVSVDRGEACRRVLAQPGWSLVLIPQTARWLSLACELAAETSAILVESCSLVRVRRAGELELCSSHSDEPTAALVGVERAIATVEEHAFRLGPLAINPIVEVQRVTA